MSFARTAHWLQSLRVVQANVLIEGATFPGRLMFHESSLEVNHNGSWAYIPVVRKHGCDGDVSIDYSTVDGTAKAGSPTRVSMANGCSKCILLRHRRLSACFSKLNLHSSE